MIKKGVLTLCQNAMEIFEASHGRTHQDKSSGQSHQLDVGCESACPGFCLANVSGKIMTAKSCGTNPVCLSDSPGNCHHENFFRVSYTFLQFR